jgi:hypothetical protein
MRATGNGLDVCCLCIYTATLQPENSWTEGPEVHDGFAVSIDGLSWRAFFRLTASDPAVRQAG